ncbi:acyltransferase [Akkermansiaceae bacterium]|nr:acyltransferase [Akkermansiaceae bacterium]
MSYRIDINALRAIAILLVICFHIDPNTCPGGFLGVDMFFIISGYLITKSITLKQDENNFSLWVFFKARIMRLLPALYFMMSWVFLAAYYLMLPDPLENFGQSVVSTVLICNNYLLLFTSGYWDLSSEYKPLLHTWSLGVEEQFYLIFSIILALTYKIGKKPTSFTIIALTVGSAALYFILRSMDTWNFNLAFYSLPTRFWQFGLGFILARYDQACGNKCKVKIPTICHYVIFVLILIQYEEEKHEYYLVACMLLTSLFLFTEQNDETFLIRAGVVQKIGRMSYSLYLWHYPIFALLRILVKDPVTSKYYLYSLPLVWILSSLSFKGIEQKFTGRTDNTRLVLVLSYGIFLFIAGLALHLSHGLPGRVFSSKEAAERSTHEIKVFDHRRYRKKEFDDIEKTNILITGDSYAADFIYIIEPLINSNQYEIALHHFLPNDFLENKKDKLIQEAEIIVFAQDEIYVKSEVSKIISEITPSKKVYFSGTKHFGSNLNWLARIPQSQRINLCQAPNIEFIVAEEANIRNILPRNYLSLFEIGMNEDKKLKITNERGELISSDRKHLTVAGVELWRDLFLDKKVVSRILGD